MLFSGFFLITGCTSPEPVVEKTERPLAHLMVLNLTDYRWRITITRSPAPPVADFQVEARESRTIDLTEGDYAIKQTVLSEGAAADLSRELSAKFQPGESYRWRLATLLSEPADVSTSP